ncbi:MAG: hypothetical protein HQ477_00185 [Chloroflexi bacterium]|nr:hypothetical protein [Chloroflexota bacterium]
MGSSIHGLSNNESDAFERGLAALASMLVTMMAGTDRTGLSDPPFDPTREVTEEQSESIRQVPAISEDILSSSDAEAAR